MKDIVKSEQVNICVIIFLSQMAYLARRYIIAAAF
jgi:hypothetical protein